MAPKTPWNEPCPCGSGEKHKACCGREAHREAGQKRNRIIAIVAAIGVAFGLLFTLQRDIENAQTDTPTKAGHIWSFEHNHFHKIDEHGNEVEAE